MKETANESVAKESVEGIKVKRTIISCNSSNPCSDRFDASDDVEQDGSHSPPSVEYIPLDVLKGCRDHPVSLEICFNLADDCVKFIQRHDDSCLCRERKCFFFNADSCPWTLSGVNNYLRIETKSTKLGTIFKLAVCGNTGHSMRMMMAQMSMTQVLMTTTTLSISAVQYSAGEIRFLSPSVRD